MPRRARQSQGFFSTAAEVLEVRALLSAGLVAAHHALQGAHAAEHASVAPAAAPPLFQGHVTVQEQIAHVPVETVSGEMTVSLVPLKIGGHVTANVTFVANLGGPSGSFKVKITGKVQSFGPDGNFTKFILTAGGSATKTTTDSNGHHHTSKINPTSDPLIIELNQQGNFTDLHLTYQAKPTIQQPNPVAFDLAFIA